MLRFKAGLVALVLVTSACSYKHSGKAMVGGAVMAGAGLYLFTGVDEIEGDSNLPTVAAGLVAVGVIVALVGLLEAVNGPPAEKPPGPAPLPKPPAVAGSEELRSQKRVAQYMAEHGKCDQVLQISVRVAAADPKFHAGNFASDATIARCLAPAQR